MTKLLFLIIAFFLLECNSGNYVTNETMIPVSMVIYKTKKDYSEYLPITLNNKKDRIVSYPSPRDIYYNGKLALPNKLKKGYYLDNRGISLNSVFTSYTYEEYSKLDKAPDLEDLMKRIIDFDPFLEIYSCGNRIDTNMNTLINKLIDNKFKDCQRIK